ncbi:MAG: hypothetical protein WBP29_12010 [Candidatus Zixiibacteriota bacterium]
MPANTPPNWVFKAAIIVALILLSPAFLNREIHNDEAWIGQHVWTLLEHGKVESELFRDYPPLDQEIVVYHKLLTWIGLGVSWAVGWGLYQLRTISFVAGLLTLLFVLIYCTRSGYEFMRWRVLAILLFTPVFWLQMLEFRPEALLLLCGFASFALLMQARKNDSLILFVLSGILAGLAGLAHAFGFVFVFAADVALISERKFRPAALVFLFGFAAFFPYISGLFTNRDLFLQQTIHNPLMTTSLNLSWWQPLVNIISEHKRILRKPEVIGITVWMLLSLPFINRDFWSRRRFEFVYLITLALVLAASPLPKFTRYMIPLIPFMAILIAEVWCRLDTLSIGRRRHLRTAFLVWAIIFFGYGSYALVAEAIPSKPNPIPANQQMSGLMRPGTLVIAPFDFVYMQQGKFTIQSWWGAERKAGANKSVAFLEPYADSLGVQYLVVDELAIKAWAISESAPANDFSTYRLLFAIPDQHRYLFGKSDDSNRTQ